MSSNAETTPPPNALPSSTHSSLSPLKNMPVASESPPVNRLSGRLGENVITTLLISNLHCFTCSSTIEELLSGLSPPPLDISISILDHKVTVTHTQLLSPRDIIRVLLEAEFELDSASSTSSTKGSMIGPSSSGHIISFQGNTYDWLEDMQGRIREAVAKKRAGGDKHLENCELCRNEFGHEKELASPSSSMRSSRKDGVTVRVGTVASERDAPTGTPEEKLMRKQSDISTGQSAAEVMQAPGHVLTDEMYEAVMSVGGMTCASCTSRVTEVLEALPAVKSVSVNLMGNSAAVMFNAKETGGAEQGAEKLVFEVEETGFECSLETLTALGGEADAVVRGQMGVERAVTLKVEGMFCDHCPGKVIGMLESSFPNELLSIAAPITRQSGHVHIKYTPRPPSFTLRHITAAISSISPGFVVSVYHPPTMEERSRQLQLRERSRLLIRLILCVIIAIPTFMIGIVWMTLVSKEDRIRKYLQEPMWSGSVTKMGWALFFLSTPVMFFVADVFHKRAIHEIRVLWRKGSNVPILRRFYRFGSMNLLVSLGVSISYFASVALLALHAVTVPMVKTEGANGHDGAYVGMAGVDKPEPHTTTYFDSTVFLTMFLLIGRFLEAYSKSKTADAVNLLGKLRPSEALLVVKADREDIAADTEAFKSSPSQSPIGENDPSNSEYADSRTWKSRTISTDLLEVGDIICVVRGSSPPADGTVISGRSQFDESSLTGEARLVPKSEGDFVYAGTINQGQVVNVRVDCIGGDSMLDQIVKVVREGQTRRAPIERLADVLTGYFVPVVTLLAITTWLVWLGLGMSGRLPDSYLDIDQGGWPLWSLSFAIAVFVIACPCGIGLAAPTALFVGSGLAAKFGILAKGGGEAFQESSWLDCIVFDKTGTLTQGGEPKVTDENVLVEDSEARQIAYAIAHKLEEGSAHPLATAVATHCQTKEMIDISVMETEETPGKGLSGVFKLPSGEVFEGIIGNERFMEENGVVDIELHLGVLDSWKMAGKSVVLLAIKKRGATEKGIFGSQYRLTALFGAADPLRPEALEVVRSLRESGISIWMISGDNEKTAVAVASMVGIPAENVIAGVLPTEKADKIAILQNTLPKRPRSRWHRLFSRKNSPKSRRAIVAMVGDGINDAPALSIADVGIAIGSGSDVAISSAKFILVSSDLRSLLTLTELASAVFRRVKFNFLWACIYNLIALPVAAGVLYPVGNRRIRLDPVWAALAMAFSSVSVVCSSLMLKTKWWGVGFRPRQERYRQ
ncbi:heavy metal translocatin [Choiromyces venosus 120613-1]|uniref:Heavy metal translocatin n=1 Tax=Choiromyces venosus 120613-1 TaxID=1336337 RepID=A0A3N4J2V7_9PEZI|nr:heavy metal translocatin [Choiromyces venosus 120613-1]